MTIPLRRLAGAALSTMLAAAGIVAALPVTGASAATVGGVRLNAYEARLVQDINAARASAHLRPLVVAAGTTDVARRWSWHLASDQALSHNPALRTDLEHAGSSRWRTYGENVGYASASSPDQLFSAYMHSPPHRANILDAAYRYVGVGAVERSMSGSSYAFNTLDFTDAYSSSYGPARVPAAGMRLDTVQVTRTTTVADLEHGDDQRFGSLQHGGVSAGPVTFDAPSRRDDGLHLTVRQSSSRAGSADLVLRQALGLSHVRRLTVRASAVDPTGRPVRAALYLVTPYSSAVYAGSLTLTSAPRDVSVPVPASTGSYRSQLVLRVDSRTLAGLSSRRSDQRARLSVYAVRAEV